MGIMRNGYHLYRQILSLALVLGLAPIAAYAATPGFTLAGGLSFTSGSLGHKSDPGYTGAFQIAIKPDPINSPELELIGRLGWHSFQTDNEDDFTVFTSELGLKLNQVFSRSPNMYFVGGGGLAKTDYGFTETSPFLSVGVGIESGSLVIESRFVRIFGEQIKETTFFPVTLGLRF